MINFLKYLVTLAFRKCLKKWKLQVYFCSTFQTTSDGQSAVQVIENTYN